MKYDLIKVVLRQERVLFKMHV